MVDHSALFTPMKLGALSLKHVRCGRVFRLPGLRELSPHLKLDIDR
jgi:hypothetical protein